MRNIYNFGLDDFDMAIPVTRNGGRIKGGLLYLNYRPGPSKDVGALVSLSYHCNNAESEALSAEYDCGGLVFMKDLYASPDLLTNLRAIIDGIAQSDAKGLNIDPVAPNLLFEAAGYLTAAILQEGATSGPTAESLFSPKTVFPFPETIVTEGF